MTATQTIDAERIIRNIKWNIDFINNIKTSCMKDIESAEDFATHLWYSGLIFAYSQELDRLNTILENNK